MITEVAQGFTTVSVKLDGATSVGEAPYVIPSTTTYYTWMVYEPDWAVLIVGPTLYTPAVSIV